MPLVGPREGRVGDVYGIKEPIWPCLRFHRLEHNGLSLVTNPYSGSGNVEAFWQAHGLPLSFVDDGCCFHNDIRSVMLLLTKLTTFHALA